MMPSFSLAALTALELAPPELIEVAAACGYDHVGLGFCRDAGRRCLSADGR
jgi:hypothetical protein